MCNKMTTNNVSPYCAASHSTRPNDVNARCSAIYDVIHDTNKRGTRFEETSKGKIRNLQCVSQAIRYRHWLMLTVFEHFKRRAPYLLLGPPGMTGQIFKVPCEPLELSCTE